MSKLYRISTLRGSAPKYGHFHRTPEPQAFAGCLLFLHHVDLLKQLAAIDDFHEWRPGMLGADDVQSGRMLQIQLLA